MLVWRRRWLTVSVLAVLGAPTGALSGFLMPRGPVSAGPALLMMIMGLLLGALAGLVTGRWWSIFLVLITHLVALELIRWPVDGPTVDGIHLSTTYGVVAFVTGRAFSTLLLILPAVVGVIYGAGLARRLSGVTRTHRARSLLVRRVLAACAVAVLGGMALVAQPGRTAPILGADGQPLHGSIAELSTARVGDHDTTLMLHGDSTAAPVLLYLAGGPGGTDIGAMRLFSESLEQDFVVATSDQRGTGTSYGALDPTSTLTLDSAVDYTIQLVEQLRARFDQDRVYLVGNSWGTVLGVLAVQRRPDLFAAYVGTGQMVSLTDTDQMFYEDSLAWARRTGNAKLEQTLVSNGPPPYDNLLNYEASSLHEREWNAYARTLAYADHGEMPANVNVDEYDLVQKVRALAATMDTFAAIYPQLQDIDFRNQAAQLQIPIYLVQGRHEARGRAVLAQERFDTVDAPTKKWIEFAQSGHRPLFEEPDRFAEVMRSVLADVR